MIRRNKIAGDRNKTINQMSECCELVQKDETRLGEQDDLLGIVQNVEIWPYEQMVYAQTRTHHRKWDAQNSLGFWVTKGLSDFAKWPDLVTVKRKKKENLPNRGLYHSGWLQGKTERKREES